MYLPTQSPAVSLQELGWVNTIFLSGGKPLKDPTIVWGTTVETEPLEAFLAEQRKGTGTILSPAHVLIRAVVESLKKHPHLNRRVVGRSVYPYRSINVVMPMLQTRTGEVDVVFLRNAEAMTLHDIAQRLWEEARAKASLIAGEERRRSERLAIPNACVRAARGIRLEWMRWMSGIGFWIMNNLRIPTFWKWQQEMNGTNAFVNFLGFPGAPPMISYKPSCLPTNSFSVSVTMGLSEKRAVVVDDAVVIRKIAPLFVRVDHRIVNGQQTAAFVSTLRAQLANPGALVEPLEGADVTRRAA